MFKGDLEGVSKGDLRQRGLQARLGRGLGPGLIQFTAKFNSLVLDTEIGQLVHPHLFPMPHTG